MMPSLEGEGTLRFSPTTNPNYELISRVKSQHNSAKKVPGLRGEKRDAKAAASPGERDSAGAKRVCTGLDPQGAGSKSMEHEVG